MFDLKKILELRKTMSEAKKRLDSMVIKETSPKGLFELTISGSQKVSEVKILKDLQGIPNEEIEKDLKELINKATASSQASAVQAMGGLGALGGLAGLTK